MELGGDGLERERGKGERSGGRLAHPQRAHELGGDGEGRRRRDGPRTATAGAGKKADSAGEWRRPGPILGAGMEEAMVRSSGQHRLELGDGRRDGTVRRQWRQRWSSLGLGSIRKSGRKRGGKVREEQHAGGGASISTTQGRGGQHGTAGEEDTAWRGSGQHCGDREDGVFAKNPLPPFPLIAKRSSSKFRDFIKAPGPFYKFHKNSCGLHLNYSCSTKFGLAK